MPACTRAAAFAFACALGAAVALSGCFMYPEVGVHQPTSVRPADPPAAARAQDGAIYQAGDHRPLFEDRRARYVGDTLTVVISEKIVADQKSSTSVGRSGNISADVSAMSVPLVDRVRVLKSLLDHVGGTQVGASSSNTMDGKGQTASSNNFSATLTVTVIEVLRNGNLLVSGEKQIGTNREKETLRFSGVVNPATIMTGNVVNSAQVADARLDYRGDGAVDSAQSMGWLQRLFLTVMPF